MKKFEAQKAYLACMFILTIFIILPGCNGGVAGGGSWDKPVVPAVSSTDPIKDDAGVATNTNLTATFSVPMDPATLKSPATNFTLTIFGSTTPIPGVVTIIGNTATFNPDSDLLPQKQYTATITTGAKSQAGIAIAANFTWSFTTGTIGLAADTTAPTLIFTVPANDGTGLAVNSGSTATFSEPMNSATLISPATNFTLTLFGSTTPIAGVVTYVGNTATFNPDIDLIPNQKYTSTITTGAKDLNGNVLVGGLIPNPWSWTTAAGTDTTAPTVKITNPVDLAVNVPVDKTINATFSEAMRPVTMISSNFTVKETLSGNAVPGNVTYDVQSNIATFSPGALLTLDTGYTVTVTNGARDLAGNALVVPAVAGLPAPNPWTFRTAAASVPVAPLAINLGRAASFGIASQAGLTSTGVTVVNGDVALYPLATCSDATGGVGSASRSCLVKTYSSTTGMTVNGSIYWAGDPFDNGGTASSATHDLNIAWVEGKNKVDTKPTVAGGQLSSPIPYLPGVYHNANLGLAASGVATLDAQNDPNAIFIFKIDSDFVDSGTLLLSSKIVLINGAQARNVWFVAGRDITVGSGTTWNGNILAGRTATVKDGSTVNGRVLAGAAGAGAITITGAANPSRTTISVPQ